MTPKRLAARLYLTALHVAVAALILVAIQKPAPHDARQAPYDASKAHYKRMQTYFLRTDGSVPAGGVLFVGDSITRSLHCPSIAANSFNLGIGSDTTDGVVMRIGQYKSLDEAAAVVFAIGTVDLRLNRAPEAILADYREALAAVGPAVKVVIVGVLPGDDRIGGAKVNDRIVALNGRLRTLAAGRENCVYVDLWDSLVDSTGNLAPDYHVGDGLHLSTAGYAIMIDALREALAPGT